MTHPALKSDLITPAASYVNLLPPLFILNTGFNLINYIILNHLQFVECVYLGAWNYGFKTPVFLQKILVLDHFTRGPDDDSKESKHVVQKW